MKLITMTAALALAVSPAPALAADYQSTPVPAAGDGVIYHKGDAIVERQTSFGWIRVKAIGEETGKPAFLVMVYNETDSSFNFGTENVTAHVEGERKATGVYTAGDIQDMVKNKAGWAVALTGLSGALARSNSYGSACGFGGCINTRYSSPDYGAQARAARQIDGIRGDTADKVEELDMNYLQTTTVMPGEVYGGKVAITKPKVKQWPARLTLTIMGEEFDFEVTK